jgi:hypothetical protein
LYRFNIAADGIGLNLDEVRTEDRKKYLKKGYISRQIEKTPTHHK